MSTNRSVQAAQRRRAGPPEPQQYSRGPTTSINSAQMFANQARPGNGPNIPSGRLAGQHATYTQNQAMQQQYQNQQQSDHSEKDGVQGLSKMTVAQAVTLITLRLGVVESKLIELEHTGLRSLNADTNSNVVQIDKNVLSTIMNRLEALEKRSTVGPGTTVGASPDITLLKQQMDTIKPVIVQTKNATVSLLKDNKDLKVLAEDLKQEVHILKDTVSQLETLTGVHTEQIKDLVVSFSSDNVDTNIDIITDENGIMTTSEYNPNEFNMNLNSDDLKSVNFIDSEYIDSNDIHLTVPPEYNAHDLSDINFEEELNET
jgi:hypothetical protein